MATKSLPRSVFHIFVDSKYVDYIPIDFHQGYGWATINESRVTPDTIFFTGSTTKAFTAAAMSILIDSGNTTGLGYKTPISSLIPGAFELQDEWATRHVTIEDMLSHRTGMPRHDLAYGAPNLTAENVVKMMRHLPMTEEPRVRFQYCNMMFTTAGYIIESLTGRWLGDILHSFIWSPLGMNSTFFSMRDAKRATSDPSTPAFLATGYRWIDPRPDPEGAGKYRHNRTTDAVSYWAAERELPEFLLAQAAGAGAVCSTVLDYTHWLSAFLTGFKNVNGSVSSTGHTQLLAPRTLTPKRAGSTPITGTGTYTLGWMSETRHGADMFSHNGAVDGFGAQTGFIPSRQWGYAIFTNMIDEGNWVADILASKLVETALAVPEGERYDWESHYLERVANESKALLKGEEALFPKTTSDADGKKKEIARLPSPVSMEAYEGTYYHPGYQFMTINLTASASSSAASNRTLLATPSKRDWDSLNYLTHISSTFFLVEHVSPFPAAARISLQATRDVPGAVAGDVYMKSRAMFDVSVDGVVERFGLEIEPEMKAGKEGGGVGKMREGMIWFERVG